MNHPPENRFDTFTAPPLPPPLIILLAIIVTVSVNEASADDPPGPVKTAPDSLSGWQLEDSPPPATQDPSNRLDSLFDDPQPTSGQKPASHDADFIKRHGTLARASLHACASCHQQRQCLTCHQGALGPVSIHPPAYLEAHAVEARLQPQACVSCHTPQTFCRDCHNLTRFGASGPASPPAGVKVHPESWLGRTPGPHHGHEARQNLMACVSCHQEQDCVQCHTRINPHPPNFIANCRRILAANGRTCAKCHADANFILSRCR